MERRATIIVLVCAAFVACGDDGGDPDMGGDAFMCRTDSDCDDGVFCNGAEVCSDAVCTAGERPCPEEMGCDEDADACDESCPDMDGDGFADVACGGNDCDDADDGRYPGNTELCDTADVDEDCDPDTFGVRDADMDGFADAACCNGDVCGPDCNDASAMVHPGEAESCDGLDNDCDGSTDEGVLNTYTVDADGDSFGSDAADAETMEACFTPSGFADRAGDCDDTMGDVNPGQFERCDTPAPGEMAVDENCDGMVNPASLCECTVGTPARDCSEGGLSGACASGNQTCIEGMWGDCSIMPVGETCNGIDDDCDGTPDEMLRILCFLDEDGDGYASNPTEQMECPDPPGSTECPSGTTNLAPLGANIDCNDLNGDVHPGATELCNSVNDDCDMAIDEEASDASTFCRDADDDMFGTSTMMMTACSAPTGYVSNCTDCDDGDPQIRPNAAEICDDVNNNCTGGIDEDPAATTDCRNRSMDAAGTTFDCASGGMCVVLSCPTDERDCDMDFLNGCEANVRDNLMACGDCMTSCSLDCDGLACDDFASISAGRDHACGVTENGRVVCWGENDEQQLGDETTMQRAGPVLVPSLSGVTKVSVHSTHSCAMTSGGRVSCWGDNAQGQTGNGGATVHGAPHAVIASGATDVATGFFHTCAVVAGGVRCWGLNNVGQLGTGTNSGGTPVRTVRNITNMGSLTGATAVAAGSVHTCAIVDGGNVVCWGGDTNGQLGDANEGTSSTVPVAVSGITDAVAISAFESHTCVLRSGGGVSCWGLNSSHQINDGGTEPLQTPVGVFTGASQISAGALHTCARAGATVTCWGGNAFGEVGISSATSPAPQSTVAGLTAARVSAGRNLSCAVRPDGSAACWGSDVTEQLGDGPGMTNQFSPSDVQPL